MAIDTKKLQAVKEAEQHLYMIKHCLWAGEGQTCTRRHLERLKEALKPLEIETYGKKS